MFRLVPIGGLGNRLRSILSYRAVHGEVEVLWARSPAVCGGWYLDAFEPLDGCTFTDIGNGHAHEFKGDGLVAYEQVCPVAGPGWTRAYWDVLPRHVVAQRVLALKAACGEPYNAIHARRGDHTEHAKLFGHFTTNEELLAWARCHEPAPLFLATDCPATQAWFRVQCPGAVIGRDVEATHGYESRPGTLIDAAVDLFMCVGAKEFMGSWISSFSETVDLLRCGGEPPGGFSKRMHMPSADAEWYRGRPDRYEEWHRSRQ